MPTIREQATLAFCGNSLYLFGGLCKDPMNDIWYYDFKNGDWNPIVIPVADYVPECRFAHTMCVEGDMIVIFGGYRR